MSDQEHALFNASGSERWSTCAASLRQESVLPDVGSKWADEGSACHTVASWCLQNDAMPDQYPNPAVEVNGAQWPVTQEMKNAAADYLGVVRSYVGERSTLLVERRVDYSHWLWGEHGPPGIKVNGAEPDSYAFGTSDAVVLDAVTPPKFADDPLPEGTMCIVDLKYGQGVQVYAYVKGEDGSATINPQLGLYALGALYEFEHVADIRYVRAIIVQPRLDHVSICDIDVTDLKIFALKMQARARQAVEVYEMADEPGLEHYAPGEKSCRFCKAKHACPALASAVETETRDLFGALVEHGASAMAAAVPADRLAQAMSKVPMIEDFCKAMRSETERRMLAGQIVPGFKLIEGRRGARKWIDEDKAQKTLRRLLGAKDALKAPEPISPTTVEKDFVKKGLLSDAQWKTLGKNIEQSDGKPSVAPEDHPSPALSLQTVETKFSALANPQAEVQKMLAASTAEDLV